MLRRLRRIAAATLILFLLPAAATAAWWTAIERPASWRSADWSSSGLLPLPAAKDEAAIYVLAARTGGLKGALSMHSWIVLKRPGEPRYERYDKVGWGSPIRRDGWAADGRWYSNEPRFVVALTGEPAARLLPQVTRAIDGYPYAGRGDYRIWPGPNSNSFVAHVLREVPALGARLPPNAVGRDFAPGWFDVDWSSEALDLHVTFGGYVGFSAGLLSGVEIHLAGLVAGFDLRRPALKLPAYGTVPLWPG